MTSPHNIEPVGFGTRAYYVRGPLAVRGTVYARQAALEEAARLNVRYAEMCKAHRTAMGASS